MDNLEHDRMVNELLDASLARYSVPAPRQGLEGRVLARVRAAQTKPVGFVWARRLAAGAVAAGIAVGLLSVVHRRNRTGNVLTATRQAASLITTPLPRHHDTISPTQSFRTAASRRVARTTGKYASAKIKIETPLETQPAEFPSPRPATSEEKLLAQYVRETPAPVLSAALTDSTTIPELEISPLNISPLENNEGNEPEDK